MNSEDEAQLELLAAVRYGDADEVQATINAMPPTERGAYLRGVRDANGNTLLHYACANFYADIARALMDAAAGEGKENILQDWVRVRNGEGNTALHWAVMAAGNVGGVDSPGVMATVELLLEHGQASPTEKNGAGVSALCLAERGIDESAVTTPLVDLLMRYDDGDDDQEDTQDEQDVEQMDSEQNHCDAATAEMSTLNITGR